MSKFGKTWWGAQWLNALNNIDYDNRLARGSSYANKGAVTKLKIEGNQIHAKVSGSRPNPYKVDIILPPFFDPELSEFILRISQRPVIISKMLNRELDSSVLEIAESMGLKVFPKQWTDFKMQCSCPDWAVPCKHLAAVIYKVSADIDNNPFLVFELHNVDLIGEMKKLGIFVDRVQTEIPRLADLYFVAKADKKEHYVAGNEYLKLAFSDLKPIHEPLLALLSDNPVFYQSNGNFKEKYAAKVNRVVKNAQAVVARKITLETLFNTAQKEAQSIGHRTNQKIVMDEKHLATVVVNEADFSLLDYFKQICQIHPNRTADYQPSTAVFNTVLHFSIHLLANGAIVPQIIQLKSGDFSVRWLPAMLSNTVKQLIEKLETMLPPNVFLYTDKSKLREINNRSAFNLVSLFLTEIIRILETKDGDDLFINLFFKSERYRFDRPGEESLSGGVQAWIQKYFVSQGRFIPKLVVSELPNESFELSIEIQEGASSKNNAYKLSDVLNNAQFDKSRYEILQSTTQLSPFISGLDPYINSLGKQQMKMELKQFAPFLIQVIPAIELLGISILLPKSLQQIVRPKTSLKIKSKSSKERSFLRLDQLLDFDWQVAIGDTVMGEQEFKQLLKTSDGLLKYKANYIYVSPQELEKIYSHFAEGKPPTSFQLLRAAISGEYRGAAINITDPIKAMIDELTRTSDLALPLGIKATLRPYQVRGYSWMYRNSKLGFGSVIADDMGLGKTLQVITTLLKYKEDGFLEHEKAMVVAPTGLLTNWQVEIEKFAPSLRSFIYHGTKRKLENPDEYDVLITSYGVMRSDAGELKKKKWHSLVIDEAQNIKNINTNQTKAIKLIPANNFIAMSGTPVENRLSELWSIMDFSNRGFLGDLKEFNETYADAIQQFNDITAADKLKKVTAPFLMRRLKSDKSVISDLPDKIEMDCFAHLTKEQASLYEETLRTAMEAIESIERNDRQSLFVRQGLVLQMILALKQICNHPTNYLKNNLLDSSLSGKMELLFDKLDSIVESGEKVLIFTQFTEMARMLKHFVNERYGEEPLFYHGGMHLKERTAMVSNFQTNRVDKIFILSLKAAGTGLNLTAANHVVHYDLWWNPAVENQATDRAYRIGQKSNVMVHRFITKNTFEEKINAMIQSKKALAEMTVSSGENWIGNLSNKELKELFG